MLNCLLRRAAFTGCRSRGGDDNCHFTGRDGLINWPENTAIDGGAGTHVRTGLLVDLSADTALDGPSRAAWASRAGRSTSQGSHRPALEGDVEGPRAGPAWVTVGEASRPHGSYLINGEHFPPKDTRVLLRLPRCPTLFEVISPRRRSQQSSPLAAELFFSVSFRCMSKMY